MSKCKSCLHAIKLHKHPLNRMFNGAISEQVDFLGCVALGKDNGVIVDRIVEECDGWMVSAKPINMSIEIIKDGIVDVYFNCGYIQCTKCVFYLQDGALNQKCMSALGMYDFAAIKSYDFGTITEVVIDDLEQFKIK